MTETKWDDRYRLLNEGEIILATDELLDDVIEMWVRPIHRVGQPAPSPGYTSHSKYRRLKEQQ